MNQIESINLDLSSQPYFVIAGIIVLIAFTVFTYRYTVPQISKPLKTFLILLRILALIFLLLLIFEPVLIINSKKTIEPVNLLFIDNSKSIIAKDSADITEQIYSLIEEFDSRIGENNLIYTFGSGIDPVTKSASNNLTFDDPVTNFADIFNFIKNSDLNIASTVIVSDGVITEGLSPLRIAEKMDIPVYTIGVGDTLSGKDIEIKKVLTNKYIYAGKSTKINVSIFNKGLGGQTVSVELSENSGRVSRKDITLNSNGINEIELNYTPQIAGEQKLSVDVTLLKDEVSSENNKSILFVNVLKSKLNILLIAGSPSADVSFIKNSLSSDANLNVESLIQLSQNRFVLDNMNSTKIDSADILFLIGFPSENTSTDLISRVVNEIVNNKKPFFISLAEGVDLEKLRLFNDAFPFNINPVSKEFINVQPNIVDIGHSLLKQSSNKAISNWNNLPPVSVTASNISLKPGANILANVKTNNVILPQPLILTKNYGSGKCIAITGKNIWRWKLTADDDVTLFDSFIANSVKWLNTNDSQKQVNITTTKKIYQSGEEIEFIAQVYDETFAPVETGDVTISIANSGQDSEIRLNSDGGGFYSAIIEKSDTGDYEYQCRASLNNQILGTDKGKFTIGEIEVEKLTLTLNKDFLFLLSTLTNGKYCYINDHRLIIQKIKKNLVSQVREEIQSKEVELWSHKIFLLLLILLLSTEWFLRKRAGMV